MIFQVIIEIFKFLVKDLKSAHNLALNSIFYFFQIQYAYVTFIFYNFHLYAYICIKIQLIPP